MISDRPSLADSHIHLFRHGYHGNKTENEEVERYQTLRLALDIGPALVVAYEGQERFFGNSQYILQLARTYDWIFPLRYAGRDTFPIRAEEGFQGYAIYLDDWPEGVTSGRLLNALSRELPASRTMISINGTPDMFDAATSALVELSDCRVLVSHLGLPGRSVSTTGEARDRLSPILGLAESVDLYVKISGLYAVDSSPDGSVAARYVEALLESLGPKRLMWGSDFTPVLDYLGEAEVFSLPPAVMSLLSDTDLSLVLSENLLGLLSS